MRLFVAADLDGFDLKEFVMKSEVIASVSGEVMDLSGSPAGDFVEASLAVAEAVRNPEDRAIVFDLFGVGSFMVLNKISGLIAANVTEENSARMTREHNNSNAITIGAGVVGRELVLQIVKAYLGAEYSGGRHQIRIDMLNKMLINP